MKMARLQLAILFVVFCCVKKNGAGELLIQKQLSELIKNISLIHKIDKSNGVFTIGIMAKKNIIHAIRSRVFDEKMIVEYSVSNPNEGMPKALDYIRFSKYSSRDVEKNEEEKSVYLLEKHAYLREDYIWNVIDEDVFVHIESEYGEVDDPMSCSVYMQIIPFIQFSNTNSGEYVYPAGPIVLTRDEWLLIYKMHKSEK